VIRTFVIRTLVNAVALWLAALVIPGIELGEGSDGVQNLKAVLLVALVFGVVNAVVKPIAKFFSFPLIILTLGLFTFIVNALMLQLTSWLADGLGLAFRIEDFFWSAVLGAVVVTIVASILNVVVPDDKDD
jgi:putative membrane protein